MLKAYFFGDRYQVGEEITYQLHRAHCRVEYKALPHTAGIGLELQLLDLALQLDIGGNADPANAASILNCQNYMSLPVMGIFRAVKIV
jgi:hypothetical protein